MSDAITFGRDPNTLRVIFTDGSDFSQIVQLSEDWPADADLTLTAGTQSWAAVIDGTDATFTVAATEHAGVVAGSVARLAYSSGGIDTVLAVGTVERRG